MNLDLTKNKEITVKSGANEQKVTPVEGERLTVGEIRRRMGDLLNISTSASALVDGEEATDEAAVGAGQTVEFVKESGSKG